MRRYHIHVRLHKHPKSISQSNQTSDESGTFLPAFLFQQLPSHKAKPTARRNATFNPSHKDYRFGPIRIDWVDFEDMSKATYGGGAGGKEKDPKARGMFRCFITIIPLFKALHNSRTSNSEIRPKHTHKVWIYQSPGRNRSCLSRIGNGTFE